MQFNLIPNSKQETSNTQASVASYRQNMEDVGGGENQELSGAKKGKGLGVLFFILLVFLLPLFALPFTLDVVPLSKQVFVSVFVLGLFVYVLGKFLNSGKIILPTKHTLYALGFFLASIVVATLFSEERASSLLGVSPDSLFWVFVYVVGFVLSLMLLNNKKAILWTVFAHISAMGVLVLLSFLHFSGISVFSVFSDDSNFNTIGSVFHLGFTVAAAFAGLVIFLSLAKSLNLKTKVFLWSCAALFALFLVQLNSSSVLIALAVALALVAPVLFSLNLKAAMGHFSETSSVLLPIVAIAASVLLIFTSASIPTTMEVAEELRPSSGVTTEVTRDSLSGLRMVYGTGPATFIYNYTEHRPQAVNETNFWGVQFEHGYSAFLTYASTWGVLGVLAFAALLLLLLKKMFSESLRMAREKRESGGDSVMSGIVAGSFATFLVFVVALFIYKGSAVMHLLMFLSAGVALSSMHVLGIKQKRNVNMASSPQLMTLSSVAAIVLISLIVGTVYFVGEKYLARAYVARGVAVFQQDGDVGESLNYFQRAIDTKSNDDFVLRVATQALYLRLVEIANAEDIDEEVAFMQFDEVLDRTVAVAREATIVNPKNRENWVQLAQVYEEVVGIAEGADEFAIEAYKNAIERDPGNPFLYLSKGRTYMKSVNFINLQIQQSAQLNEGAEQNTEELDAVRNQRLDSARSSLEKAIELKADYSPAQFLIAQVYSELGDLARAIEEAESVVAANPRDPSAFYQLGLFLYENEEYEESKDAMENAISLANEQFANARYFLGLALYELGDLGGSVAQFERIYQDNPESEIVESILENLRAGSEPLAGLEEPGALPPAPPEEDMEGGAEDHIMP